MKIVAKPVAMIATFSSDRSRKPVPYKWRFYRDSGEKVEVVVDMIQTVEESRIAGIDALIYTCQSKILDRECIYQLKYIIGQYRWELYKV